MQNMTHVCTTPTHAKLKQQTQTLTPLEVALRDHTSLQLHIRLSNIPVAVAQVIYSCLY